MILVLNSENEKITLGTYQDNCLLFTATISVGENNTPDEIAVKIKNIIELYHISPSQITGGIISAVVASMTSILWEGIKILCSIHCLVVGPGIKTGLDILIDNPSEMGADLVATSVAAISKFKKPVIIIHMCTATTISVINAKSQHMGVVIMAGLKLSLDALVKKAPQLPSINLKRPRKIIGSNSVESLESGILFGMSSMLEGMIDKIENELAEKCTVVITGEYAEIIFPLINRTVVYEKSLLLEGLFLLYNKNCVVSAKGRAAATATKNKKI